MIGRGQGRGQSFDIGIDSVEGNDVETIHAKKTTHRVSGSDLSHYEPGESFAGDFSGR